MRAARALLLALTLLAAAAGATEPAPPALAQAVPAGNARLTFWGFAVYDARLWVTQGFRRSGIDTSPLALELTYLRSFRGADIAKRSLEEMQRSGPIEPGQARTWEEQLAAVLPDVKEGDRLLGVHRPGQGVEFFSNRRRIGEIADPHFARRFFGIWLGPATSQPAMRDALLAGTSP
jgi:hypothetical protein